MLPKVKYIYIGMLSDNRKNLWPVCQEDIEYMEICLKFYQ